MKLVFPTISRKTTGPLFGLLVFVACAFVPASASAAFPVQEGKQLQPGGARCQIANPGAIISGVGSMLDRSEQEMRSAQSNGLCEQYYTDGSRDVITFDYERQTLTIQHWSASSFFSGSQQVGEPQVLSWVEAAQQGTQAAQAAAAADPNNAAAQAAVTAAQENETEAAADTAAAVNNTGHCEINNLTACITSFIEEMVKRVALFFLFVASAFLAIAGLLFNWTIYITIFQFGNLIGNNAGMLAAWGVLRDIGNIILLFGFIFMGVSTVLQLPGNEFTAKKALPALIIFAILLNFSLFAAEAVIDTSNGIGSSFYRQAGNGFCPEGIDAQQCATEYGMAGAILTISGVTSIFDVRAANTFPDNGFSTSIAIIGLTLFMGTAAFVLCAAVFMLIFRACTLAFLMVVSPIGFAGMAVPILHKYAKTWWEQLLSQAFFAPVYILMILISIKFMDGVRTALGVTDGMTLAQTFAVGQVNNLSMVVLFILLIGFLLMATQAAKSMSAMGAGASTKWAGALVFGGMARVNNMAIGGAARTGRMIIQKTPLRSAPGARFLTNNIFTPIQNANLDVRRIPGYSNIQKVAGGPAEHASYTDMMHQKAQVKANMDAANRRYDNEAAQAKLNTELAQDAVRRRLKQPVKGISEESERYLLSLSGEQIAANHELSHAMHELADKLTADQFEAYMRSDKVSDTEKGHARDARYRQLIGQIGTSEGAKIRKWSAKDLEQFMASPKFGEMDPRQKAEFISLLSDDQYEALSKSTRITNTQKADIQGYREKQRFDGTSVPNVDPNTGAPYPNRRARTLGGMNSEKRAKLDDEILARREVYTMLEPADFDAIRRAQKLSKPQRQALGQFIDGQIAANNPDFVAYRDRVSPAQWDSMRAFYDLQSVKPARTRARAGTRGAGAGAAGGGAGPAGAPPPP